MNILTWRSQVYAVYAGVLILLLLFDPIPANAQPDYVTSADVYTGRAEIGARQRVTLQKGFRAFRGCRVRVYTDANLALPQHNYQPAAGNTLVNATPNSNKNYIKTTTLRMPTTNASQISQTHHTQVIEYFDGLGRPLQTVVPKGSPQQKDIVTPFSYDNVGRIDKKYLPYVSSNSNGSYNSNALTQVISFHEAGQLVGREADGKPYSTILYDNSPLNRITGEVGIGADWKNNPVCINYTTNTTTIQHWKVTGASPGEFTAFNFPANSLYVTENIDEDGSIQRSYTDKLGQTVRVENIGDNSEILRTAYIYDDFGLLRCVVPPKANSPADPELCYFYNYDHRKRLIEKRIPGAQDWVYYIYDKRDRLVMWTDPYLYAQYNKFYFQLYDALNRPVVSGIITVLNYSISQIQNHFANHTGALYEEFSPEGALFGYTNLSFPLPFMPDIENIQTVTWYDNYGFKQLPTIGANYDFPPIPPGGNTSNNFVSKVKGMITGSLERVDGLPGLDLVTVYYYDNRLRLICSVSDNHLGGRNNEFFGYNFSNDITESITTHYVNGQVSEQIVLITQYGYDHQGRLLEEKLKLNDNDFITLKALQYNEIGDVINTYLHSSAGGRDFNQKIQNTYNIRGWLRKMNDPDNIGHNLFALDLRYQNPSGAAAIDSGPRYNGNITQMLWNSKYDKPRAYGFSYDPLNRLTAAGYGQGSGYNSNAGYFNTTYDYDAIGNIENLTRKRNNIFIDVLTYTYNSKDQLHSVSDRGTSDGYVPVSGSSRGYWYYPNGNLWYDPSKKIEVSYNHLNLPNLIEFDNRDYITYAYTASGVKLRKTITTWKTATGGVTDYSGPFLYHDNQLSCIFTPAGRIIPITVTGNVLWKYEYNLTDHLGNVRVVFAAHSHGQPEVMQQTSYYPFGMTLQQQNFGGLNTNRNRLLYNSKELQDDELAGIRLDWYDYGARFYDPQLSRWHTVDPMAEERYWVSPYNFVQNNPINRVDPTGMLDDWVEDKNRRIYWDEYATSQATAKAGETYLGQNVLVGTHNRDANLNEPINTAKFELYLESNKEGPSATIMGNTVPADVDKYGTVAEGLYPAGYSIYKGDGAILINGGGDLPTVKGNPNNKKNYNAEGTLKPIDQHVIDEVFFHKGNYARPSLSTSSGSPISAGCQTGGCGPGTLPVYREFIKKAEGFKGSYYLRPAPKQ